MKYSADYHQKLLSIPLIDSGKISSKLSQTNGSQLIDIEFTTSFICTLLQKKRSFHHSFTVFLNEQNGQSQILGKTSQTVFEPVSVEDESTNSDKEWKVKFLKSKMGLTPNKELRLVELWKNNILVKVFDVTDLHGRVYPKGSFGGVAWSQNGDKFAYIAEKIKKANESEKDVSTKSTEPSKLKHNNKLESDDYEYKQTWGETYGELSDPVIVYVDLTKYDKLDSIQVLDTIDRDLVPGQLVFGSNDNELYFTGYHIFPRKHGIVYCPNRPSDIYKYSIEDGSYNKLTDSKLAYRSPKIFNDQLFYMGMNIGGAHNQCSSIFKSSLNQFQQQEIIPVVQNPKQDEFPGVYTLEFGHDSHLIIDNKTFLLLNSQWRCFKVILALDIETNEIYPITPHPTLPTNFEESVEESLHNAFGSWTLLNSNSNTILAKFSAPQITNQLILGIPNLSSDGKLNIQWSNLRVDTHDEEFDSLIHGTSWETYNNEDRDDKLECIVIRNKKHSNKRLIASIHGGPHSSNFIEFNLTNLLLLSLGFTVLHINYSGSLGYGQEYNNKLIGKVGDLDVKDCYYSILKTLQQESIQEAPYVIGGSHGGFLTAHLIGQYPDTFKAAILHNPVINIGANIFLTDITDWNFSECGLDYNFFEPMEPTAEVYAKLYSHSPHQYFANVKTPSLVLLGEKDLRVPYQQSIIWWFHVRKLHPDLMKLISVPNTGHSIDSAEGTIVRLQAIHKFLDQFI